MWEVIKLYDQGDTPCAIIIHQVFDHRHRTEGSDIDTVDTDAFDIEEGGWDHGRIV